MSLSHTKPCVTFFSLHNAELFCFVFLDSICFSPQTPSYMRSTQFITHSSPRSQQMVEKARARVSKEAKDCIYHRGLQIYIFPGRIKLAKCPQSSCQLECESTPLGCARVENRSTGYILRKMFTKENKALDYVCGD